MDQVGETLDAVVIGAGWAGLGIAYCLRQAGLNYCVLERARIGETWRTQRWDSFHFNLPNCYSVLPGDTYDGNDPEGFMTHTEFFAYLDDYSRRHNLRVLCSTPATKLDVDGTFRVHTPGGTLRATSVVVASGSLNRPRRPPVASKLVGPFQIDASDYRNAAQLPSGAVLVVGSAQSGCQIAEDLALAGRKTYLSRPYRSTAAQVPRARYCRLDGGDRPL